MGTVLLFNCESLQDLNGLVSIPSRYGITYQLTNSEHILHVTVSIPYRYGITLLIIDTWLLLKKFLLKVSIPYRYGITCRMQFPNIMLVVQSFNSLQVRYYNTDTGKSNRRRKFQFLIGTVLQQYFRRFLALSSFFSSNLIKKSVDLTFYYRKFP